jgi:HlyD family secretion protein
MNMKKILIIALIVVIAGVVAWRLLVHSEANNDSQYSFVQVQRGNIQTIVSSTGTLQAVETVNVGTQVSGTIEKIFVDFNDKVTKGQLLARLDTSLLKIAVRDAEANVASAQAQYNQSQRSLDRDKNLFDKKLISDIDYNQSLTNSETAYASLLTAQSALNRAKINLNYAEIRSPIDGVVIERSVDEGQTVAASLSAPTLFIIARDLNKMQILAQADESDIGQIHEGQTAHFTVPAYPDKTFEGKVQQIRLQPETVSNVVVYTVVVDAENNDRLLLPGMTATVDFIVQDVQDVLYVPNSVLKFQPADNLLVQAPKNHRPPMSAASDSSWAQRHPHPHTSDAFAAGGTNPSQDMAKLYTVDSNGILDMIPVHIGATNGTITEIKDGPRITEGMKIVSGIHQKNDENSQKSKSTNQSRPAGPPRFF